MAFQRKHLRKSEPLGSEDCSAVTLVLPAAPWSLTVLAQAFGAFLRDASFVLQQWPQRH